MVILAVVEVTIWLRVVLGLTIREPEVHLAKIMFRSSYRLLWWPKLVAGVADVILFCFAADYYRGGGMKLWWAMTCFAMLTIFSALAFLEGVRAVKHFKNLLP